jgi:hypothetical protein
MRFSEFLNHFGVLDRSKLYLHVESNTAWCGIQLDRKDTGKCRTDVAALQSLPAEAFVEDLKDGESIHTARNDALLTTLYELVETVSFRGAPEFLPLLFNAAEALATHVMMKIDDVQAVHVCIVAKDEHYQMNGGLMPFLEEPKLLETSLIITKPPHMH